MRASNFFYIQHMHLKCTHDALTALRHPSVADWRSQINNPYMPIVNHRVRGVFLFPDAKIRSLADAPAE